MAATFQDFNSIIASFRTVPMPLSLCLPLRDSLFKATSAENVLLRLYPPVVCDGGQLSDATLAAMLKGTEIGAWSLAAESIDFLAAEVLRLRPTTIAEFGSGVSTIIFAYLMNQLYPGDGRPLVFSIEQSKEIVEKVKGQLHSFGLENKVRFLHAPVTHQSVNFVATTCYSLAPEHLERLFANARPELVLVDGPAGDYGTRFATVPLIRRYLHPYATVYMDDALRDSELAVADWWSRLGYLDVKGVVWSGKGFVIAQNTGSRCDFDKNYLSRLASVAEKSSRRPAEYLRPPGRINLPDESMSRLRPVKTAKGPQSSFPRFSFVIIVLNGMPFLEYALRAIYEFAHEVIIVEGAVDKCLFAANPDGSSTDSTVEFITSFPDAAGKIRFIQGKWPEKCEMQNAALRYVTGDYVWLVDSDEVYKEQDLLKVESLIKTDPGITQINFICDNFWKGFDYIFLSSKFFEESTHYRRVFKYVKGARFVSHRPPTMVYPGSSLTTEQMRLVDGSATRQSGIIPFHYSYVLDTQVKQKINLYRRYGWGNAWGLDLEEWYHKCFLGWRPDNRAAIESRYPVWTGDRNSLTVKFHGAHPEVMQSFIQNFRTHTAPDPRSPGVMTHLVSTLIKLKDRFGYVEALETGTIRSYHEKHESTRHISECLTNCGRLISVDINPESIRISKDICKNARNVEWVEADSISFLRQFRERRFHFALLDSVNNKDHILEEFTLVIPIMIQNSIIIVDDAGITEDGTMIDQTVQSQKGHRIWELLNSINAQFTISLCPDGHGTQLIIPLTWGNLKRIKQALGQPSSPVFIAPRKAKVARANDKSADLTEVNSHSRFADELQDLFRRIRPKKLIETGTYLGTGTTAIIASSLKQLGINDATFYTIEVNPLHYKQAVVNLTSSGLLDYVAPLNGLTIPRVILPSLEEIEDKYVNNIECGDIFVDHAEANRATLYYNETDYDQVPDNMLDSCLIKFDYRPDFVLLDSAGHVGNIEFNFLISKLKAPCHIALDDIFHVKHHEDFLLMQTDPRFEILVYSEEKFGFCIAKYTPANQVETAEVKNLLWVRTDSIGDAVLSASMLPHIRARYPSASIGVLCQEHVAEIYQSCPYIDEIITFNRQKAFDDREYREAVSRKLVQLNADLMLNSIYSRDLLSDYFSISSGARKRIAMHGDLSNISEEARKSNNSNYTSLASSPGDCKTELDRHKDFLSALSISAYKLKPEILLSREDIAFADEFFAKSSFDSSKTIALFAGAQFSVRLYNLYGQALADICRDEGYSLIAIGSRGDYGINQECLDAAVGVKSLNLSGATTIRQSSALLSKCRLAVGAETGLAHIACAVNTPNVILLGGGHFGRFMPYSPLTTIACLPLDCYGCNWQCRYSRVHCVRDVYPEVIARAVRTALEGISQGPRIILQPLGAWRSEPGLPNWKIPNRCESTWEYIDAGPSVPIGPAHILPGIQKGDRSQTRITANDGCPLISAIVSTYNAERFIRGCLEDLEAQTIADKVEIIVIDSGSEQNERNIVEEFQKQYDNIRYFRTERESLYAAWNRGIQLATGRYITNANTDDRHRRDALQIQVETLEKNPGIDLVYGDCFISEKFNETFDQNQKQQILTYPDFFAPDVLFRYQFGPQPMWRKNIHEQLGFFDERFQAAGDYDFNIRFCFHRRAMHIPEFLGLYLKHDEALTFKDSRSSRETRWIIGRYRTPENVEPLYAREGAPCNSDEERARIHLDFGARLLRCHVPLSWFHLRRSTPGISGFFVRHLAFASNCFIISSRLAPRWVAPYNNLAVSLYLMDLPQKAIRLLDKASKAVPDQNLQFNRNIITSAEEESWKYSHLKLLHSGISFAGCTALPI